MNITAATYLLATSILLVVIGAALAVTNPLIALASLAAGVALGVLALASHVEAH